MTVDSRRAKTVAKSTTRRRILIGVVDSIRVSGEVRCGGAAVSRTRMLLGASSPCTSPRMMTLMTWMRRIKRRLRLSRMSDVPVARRWDTRLRIVREIPTLDQVQVPISSLPGSSE